jgi:GPH family glycoside/pentoside/hexuronide:cation symporter
MRGELVPQPPSAIHALYISFAVIPAVLFIGNALCLYLYDLDERKLHEGAV